MLGKTAAGKSETANSILGQPELYCLPGERFSTWTCLKKGTRLFEKNILVIDTPGLLNTIKPGHVIRSEIQNSTEMAYPVSRMAQQLYMYMQLYCV